MLNERKLERQQLIYSLAVTNAIEGYLIGNLYDINVGGMQLANVSRQMIASKALVDVRLPEVIYGENHLVAVAVCRWQHGLGHDLPCSAGLEFCQLSVLEQERVGRLIADYGYPIRARPYSFL